MHIQVRKRKEDTTPGISYLRTSIDILYVRSTLTIANSALRTALLVHHIGMLLCHPTLNLINYSSSVAFLLSIDPGPV